MDRIKSKVAIITGAARGLGKAIAVTLAKEGADIIIWDLAIENAKKTSTEIRELGRRSLSMRIDVSDSSAVEEAAQEVLEKHGQIDILVNNAGIVSAQRTILELSNEQWEKEIAVNLTGTFLCTKAILRHMIDRRSGKIVNISSLAAETGRPFTSAAYSAAKAGILGFTMSVARSVAQYGINVNAVCPGLIITDIHRSYSAEQLEVLQADIPLNKHGVQGHKGVAQDVANVVLFLCSSESEYITGARIRVNGGSLMG